MRKLIVCNIMTVDGYYEGPEKNVMDLFRYRFDAYPADESFDTYNAERLRAADMLLLGRSSYEGFKAYWPSIADDPSAPPIAREISRLNNAIDKVVVSDQLTPANTHPWSNTHIIRRADARARIVELKNQGEKEILIFGSHTLWNDLLTYGLVDELHLMIAPVVSGGGTPIFSSRLDNALRLMDTYTWPGSGIVLARYKV